MHSKFLAENLSSLQNQTKSQALNPTVIYTLKPIKMRLFSQITQLLTKGLVRKQLLIYFFRNVLIIVIPFLNSSMKKVQTFLILLVIAVGTTTESQEFTYGPNLVFNWDFSTPALASNTYMKSFPPSIMGWKCLNYCYLIALPLICYYYNLPCQVPYLQGIDLNSQCIFENVTQTISIETEGDYLLHFQFVIPLFAPIGKRFTVWLNETVVINITHNSTALTPNRVQHNFSASKGNLTISMMMTGGNNDCWGTVITNVSIIQKIYPYKDQQFESFIEFMMNNNITTIMNQMPGNRVFLNVIMNQYRLIDRMQFYYYHQLNLSYYSDVFLSNINQMALEKGSLLQVILQSYEDTSPICSTINEGYINLFDRLNQKYEYSDADFLAKNPNGIGFYANNLDFFYYELPLMFMIHFLLAIIFNLLFNHRVSLLLRKYSFYGTLLFIIYEGNVESFAFYFFAECKNLFSADLVHKIANVLMIYFFFLLIIFVIGGMLWFTYHYKKLTKYFIQDFDLSIFSVILESLERSIFPLVYGCVHILLKQDIKLQTLILGVIEVGYLTMRLVSLRSLKAKRRMKIFLTFSASLLRMTFISTFYLYEVNSQPSIINSIHYNTIILYIITGFLQFLEEILNSSLELKEGITKWCKKKRSQEAKEQTVVQTRNKIERENIMQSQDLKETKRPETRTILRQRSTQKKTSTKKVRILTEKRPKNSGIYCVKGGKVYTLSDFSAPIANSQVEFFSRTQAQKQKTVNINSSRQKSPKPPKTFRSCQNVK